MYLIDQTDNEKMIDTLNGVRSVIDQSILHPVPFEYSEVFLFTEQVPTACNQNSDIIATW